MADANGPREPCRFTWILDDLAVGGVIAGGGAAELARTGIGAVVNVRLDNREAEELGACGVELLHLPAEDLCAVSQDMLDRAVAFARRAAERRRRLLVHCEHGIGRAPLVVLCVLVDRGLPPLQALRLAKAARERISPSPAQYEAWAAWLRSRGLGDAVPSFDEFAAVAYRQPA